MVMGDVSGGGKMGKLSGGVTLLREVKDVRKVCQLMERCDGHGGDVKVSKSVTVIREM